MTATPIATRVIQVRTSPHVHAPRSVDMIMRNVIYALLPIAVYGVLLFGWSALALMATTTATCVAAEHLYCRLLHRESSVNDYSAAITGLLLGLILPPGLPLWMGVLGSLIAVLPGKIEQRRTGAGHARGGEPRQIAGVPVGRDDIRESGGPRRHSTAQTDRQHRQRQQFAAPRMVRDSARTVGAGQQDRAPFVSHPPQARQDKPAKRQFLANRRR